jgi:signal transduction histidine kinase/CheY-like chemotaxis protein
MYRRLQTLLSGVISLPAQLLLTMVSLVVGTIAGLTIVAYQSSRDSLEEQALQNVRLVAQARAQSVQQLLQLRQQAAEGFLTSVESLCAEPRTGGGFGWAEECTATMVREFAIGEGARALRLQYGTRVIGRVGRTPMPPVAAAGPIASFAAPEQGRPDYLTRAERGQLSIDMLYDGDEIQQFFDDRSGLGRSGEVFLMDASARFLTASRYGPDGTTPPGAALREARVACTSGAGEAVDLDYRGVRTFHGFTPVPALGNACVDAHIAYDEAIAPAEQLRSELASRGGIFALLGVFVSLIAAQMIAAPVKRLAAAAGALQAGQFDVPVPVAGPQEVRHLGRAFAGMAAELAAMVKGERAARREAEAANRSKDQFLAMVSHEMRTPLSAILGWTKLLRGGRLDPDKSARALDAVERSANAQRRLIDDLLDVSRIVAGRLRMIQTPVSLPLFTSAALDAVKPLADERGVLLDWDIEPGDLTVTGDAQRLQQVVWNLAWNAIKFTPEGGRVRVSLRRAGSSARLAVSDTGAGIAAAFLPHVFEWYRQDETGRSAPEAGLGLGLALVKELVALHGGTVHAESAGEGAGATFVVMLPLASATLPAVGDGEHVTAEPIDERRVLDGVRVLVVEDDDATRMVVRAVLEDAGAQVCAAGTGADARREWRACAPDVVISDIAMPQEDGYTFLRRLRQEAIHTPAIALTSWARREDVEHARAAGFQAHLAKPLDPERLVQTVAILAHAGGTA